MELTKKKKKGAQPVLWFLSVGVQASPPKPLVSVLAYRPQRKEGYKSPHNFATTKPKAAVLKISEESDEKLMGRTKQIIFFSNSDLLRLSDKKGGGMFEVYEWLALGKVTCSPLNFQGLRALCKKLHWTTVKCKVALMRQRNHTTDVHFWKHKMFSFSNLLQIFPVQFEKQLNLSILLSGFIFRKCMLFFISVSTTEAN